MYKEYPTFYYYDTKEYGRKSRTDDPLLITEETFEKHSKIIEKYAIKHLGGPIPDENKYMEVGSGESLKDRPEITHLLKDIEDPAVRAIFHPDSEISRFREKNKRPCRNDGASFLLFNKQCFYVSLPSEIFPKFIKKFIDVMVHLPRFQIEFLCHIK